MPSTIESIDDPPDVWRQKWPEHRFKLILGDRYALGGHGIFNGLVDIERIAAGIDDELRRIVSQVKDVAAAVDLAIRIGLPDHEPNTTVFVWTSGKIHFDELVKSTLTRFAGLLRYRKWPRDRATSIEVGFPTDS